MQHAPGYRLTIVAGALVALMAAFALGLAIGGGDDGDGTPAAARAPRSYALVGPATIREGVPLGYPRTREGAIAAVMAYGQVFANADILFDRNRRRRALGLMATDRYAETFEDSSSAGLDRAADNLGADDGAQTVFIGAPVSYSVERYTRELARVRTWGVSVSGNDGDLAPRADWRMTTTTVKWVNGGWRIDASRATGGPTPAAGARPSDARELLDELARMREPRYAP